MPSRRYFAQSKAISQHQAS